VIGIVKPKEDGHCDDQRLGDVCWQYEQDCLLDVIVDGASFFHGRRDRSEFVIREDHLSRLLRDLGTFDAHRDTDVGLLQRWGVVDAVARHRNNLLVRLDRFH
jgi:hypothetical protein